MGGNLREEATGGIGLAYPTAKGGGRWEKTKTDFGHHTVKVEIGKRGRQTRISGTGTGTDKEAVEGIPG